MNNITTKIILSAIATITIASLQSHELDALK